MNKKQYRIVEVTNGFGVTTWLIQQYTMLKWVDINDTNFKFKIPVTYDSYDKAKTAYDNYIKRSLPSIRKIVHP
jgi:hypothetical protein